MSFRQLTTILLARKWLIIISLILCSTTTTIITLFLPKQYIATTTLILDQRAIEPISGAILPTQLMPGYIDTQVNILKSRNVALKVVDSLKLYESDDYRSSYLNSKGKGSIRDWIADELLESIDVETSQESSIIQLSSSSKNPQRCADIANRFASSFIQTAIDLSIQPAKQSASWFNEQANTLREDMENKYKRLSIYQQQNEIVTTREQLDIEDARLSEIAKQLLKAQEHTYELLTRKKQLSEALSGRIGLESLEEILRNSFIQTLKSQLAVAEGEFASLRERYDSRHPRYQQSLAEIISLKKRINIEIKTVINGIKSNLSASMQKENKLSLALKQQKDKLLKLKKQYSVIELLKGEIENSKKAYDQALQRAIQTRMQSELRQASIAILNPAIRPQKPSKPKLTLNVLLSLIVGTIFGLCAALVIELIDRRIRTPEDIIFEMDLPVFGILESPKHISNI